MGAIKRPGSNPCGRCVLAPAGRFTIGRRFPTCPTFSSRVVHLTLIENRYLLYRYRSRRAALPLAAHAQNLNFGQGRLGDEDALIAESGVGGDQGEAIRLQLELEEVDRKSTRLNSSHLVISY